MTPDPSVPSPVDITIETEPLTLRGQVPERYIACPFTINLILEFDISADSVYHQWNEPYEYTVGSDSFCVSFRYSAYLTFDDETSPDGDGYIRPGIVLYCKILAKKKWKIGTFSFDFRKYSTYLKLAYALLT